MTNVVAVQPAPVGATPVVPQVNQGRPWTSGLCGCTEDIKSCCCVAFCGPCYMCTMSQKMGEHCCVPCCVPGAPVVMRTKLRTMYNIEGGIMEDCCMTQMCGPCVLCQMKREMTAMGLWP